MGRSFSLAIPAFILLVVAFFLLSTRQASIDLPKEAEAPKRPNPYEHRFSQHDSEVGGISVQDLFQGKRLSVEEFRALSQEVAKSLPTKQDLLKLRPEDIHLTPGPVLFAGERLGLVAQAVYNEPSLGEESLAFYLDCANSPMYPDSVRALCYANYMALAKRLTKSQQDSSVPADIRELARKLQGL